MTILDTIKKAPPTPGVYIFKNNRGRIIYVGKAANLRSRLRSYARPGWKEQMLKEASSLSWEELASDIEALIREAELIKTKKPHYNILFRDDKDYFYVAFSKDTYPRIFLTHQPYSSLSKTQASYIGPFTDGNPIKEVLRTLRKAFPYCTCSSRIRHKRRCVNAEIGKCLGFCCADIPATPIEKKRYRQNITAIKKILSGKSKTLRTELEKTMARLARTQHYEEAAVLRNQCSALDRIFAHKPYIKRDLAEDRSKGLRLLGTILEMDTELHRIECYDISHHQGDTPVASMVVFENGLPAKQEYRKFNIKYVSGIDDFAMMQEVLIRRFGNTWPQPDLIIIDGGKGQLSAARQVIPHSVPVASIAKREEELYVQGKKTPYPLKTLPNPLLHLITHIRDEAHRFAISFHRKRRRRLVIPH